MLKPEISKRGVALYLVLATLLVVTVLANVVLTIISSQSRLTHHQVSRIQAYYASMAGINYALEKLRNGEWQLGQTHTVPFDTGDFYPPSIKSISVIIKSPGSDPRPDGSGSVILGCAPIIVTVDYTYPNP